jgi:hypothetical protein
VERVLQEGMFQGQGQAAALTEWDLAQYLSLDRIWDCGSMKFNWKKNDK